MRQNRLTIQRTFDNKAIGPVQKRRFNQVRFPGGKAIQDRRVYGFHIACAVRTRLIVPCNRPEKPLPSPRKMQSMLMYSLVFYEDFRESISRWNRLSHNRVRMKYNA